MHAVMNDTKWDELRLTMYELDPSPRWRTRDVENGYESEWSAAWYYRFRGSGYETIEWVEIEARDADHLIEIVTALRKIHVPGRIDGTIVTVFGHVEPGMAVDWL